MKNRQDLLFLIIGVLLFFALALFAFYSVSFLISKINAALSVNIASNDQLVRLDLERLKNIKIAEEIGGATETKETVDNIQ